MEEEPNMFEAEETTDIQVNNTSQNYYKEALEKEKANRALNEGSDSEDKENHRDNNIQSYINLQDSANLPTAHFGVSKQKTKKKSKKTKEKEPESRKSYHYLK